MIVLEIQFLAGRFHATPWGHHVNEGLPEWPPSPWRLLRALVALWHRNMSGQSTQLLTRLLTKLSALPSYCLPPATLGHSQHYMPSGSKQRLVFDTFVIVDKEKPLYVIWDNIEIDPEEEELLEKLLIGLTYFGRAESWADARLVSQCPEPNCYPLGNNVCSGEVIRLLAPVSSPNILANLQFDTQEKRSEGIIDPEGSTMVEYVRSDDAFAVSYPEVTRKSSTVNIVRFSMYGKPLPRIKDTLAIGELARLSSLSRYGRMNEGAKSPLLSGKDSEGNPLTDHGHAYYLPTDEDRDGILDHLTVYCPQGISGPELDTVTSLRTLNPGDNKPTIDLLLLGRTAAEDIHALPFAKSSIWTSITPFVLGRFPKYYRTGRPKVRDTGLQIDGPVDQVFKEWELRRTLNPDLPRLISVELLAHCQLNNRPISWASFRIWRKWGRGTKTPGLAYGFILQFSQPVCGPINLGYGSHFGLGMFFPACTSEVVSNV